MCFGHLFGMHQMFCSRKCTLLSVAAFCGIYLISTVLHCQDRLWLETSPFFFVLGELL